MTTTSVSVLIVVSTMFYVVDIFLSVLECLPVCISVEEFPYVEPQGMIGGKIKKEENIKVNPKFWTK